MSLAPPDEPQLATGIVSARPLVEYRAMFALTTEDLMGGPILDCPGGASSFGAEAREIGAQVTSVDPLYEDGHREVVAARALSDTDRAMTLISSYPDRYVWPFFHSFDHYLELRRGGAKRFAADISEHPEHYLSASLPELPFADDAFSLALSSHLIFTYADRFDFDFHVASCAELLRVAPHARIYPLVDYAANPYEEMDALRQRLDVLGIQSEIRRVAYEFQRGANSMLVLTR